MSEEETRSNKKSEFADIRNVSISIADEEEKGAPLNLTKEDLKNFDVFQKTPVQSHRKIYATSARKRGESHSHKIAQRTIASESLGNPSSAPVSYKTMRKNKRQSQIDELLQTRNIGKTDNVLINDDELLRPMRMNSNSNIQRPPSRAPTENSEYEDILVDYNIRRSSAQLIDEHLKEIQIRINGHTRAALRYEKRDRIIGYPVTLLSSFIASTLMMNLSQDDNHNQRAVDIVGFSLSVISFVLSLSREYLKYITKFQAHDISSKLYTNLLRSIEVRLIKNNITQDDKRDMFKDIVDQMSIIEQYELPIPSDISKEVRSETFLPRSMVINQTLRTEENMM